MVEHSVDKMVVDWDAWWVGWKAASMVGSRVALTGAMKAVEMAGSRVALKGP